MKSSTLDQSDKGKDGRKSVEILADGSRITKYTKTQTLIDGSTAIKTREVRTGNRAVPNVKKEIKTTITRMDPNGKVGTTITTEETITAPHNITSKLNSEKEHGTSNTQKFSLPDGSRVIVTKVTNMLMDGSLSTVATTIHMNPVESNYETATSLSGSTEAFQQTQTAPRIDIISQRQPPLPHGYTNNFHLDNDAKVKSSCNSPGLEIICSAHSAIIPPQFIMKKDTALSGDNKFAARPPNNNDLCEIQDDSLFNQDTVMLEMLDSTHEEPIPVQVDKANTTKQRYYNITLDPEGNANYDGDMSATHNTTQVRDCNFRPAATEADATIPVATAVYVPDEESIHEATTYSSNLRTPFYKTKRIIALTFMLLVAISAVVAVAVVVSTKRVKEVQNVEVVASPPTLSPTTERGAEIPAIIERNVLKRNITWSNLPFEDPRYLALNWILHEDEMQLQANDTRLNQRYTLALMGIQFDYLAWNSNGNKTWLTSTDECEWFGVSCSKDGKVTGIELSSNNMNGEIPPEIGNLRFIERLVLDSNCLFGTMPSEIGLMSDLQLINLQSNGLSGFVADELYNLTSLAEINLVCQSGKDVCRWKGNCTASDESVINPCFQKGDPENHVNIGFQSEFLQRIGQLRHLTFVDIFGNTFSGSVASDIGDLQKLDTLSAGYNYFNGTIPQEITTLRDLRVIRLNGNFFSGTLPENIGDVSLLEELRFGGDKNGKMTGTIPDSFYNLTHLKQFSITNHALEGQIKSEIGNLKNLTHLDLMGNKLTGTLPSELGLCKKLVLIQLHDTNIEGTVPEEVCVLKNNSLALGNGVKFFTADCAPENGTAFLECAEECCNMCCEHTTKTCF